MSEGPAAAAPGWLGLHCFLSTTPEDTDAFLVEEVAPLLDGLVAGRPGAAWFFIRYNEGGPHLRVRVRGLDDGAALELRAALDVLAKGRDGRLAEVAYVPETERYGGPAALPVAEEVFVRSTRVAVEAVARTRRGSERLALGVDLAHATALALGLDRHAAARWLRVQAAGWRWATDVPLLPTRFLHAQVNVVYAAQREALLRRADALRQELAEVTAAGIAEGTADADGPAARWAREVAAADGELRALDGSPNRLWVWGSQLHMLLNRIGIVPDEERAVCRLAARALMDAGEPASYFPVGHLASDRQYLESSRFRIGRDNDSLPRPLAPAADPGPAALGAELALPAEPLPDVSLRTAIAGRVSVRGPLGGPLTATGLGTLLWGAHAFSHTSEVPLADGTVGASRHRPYPSAGALYTAGLRLFALDVEGLPPGTYQCVPERRSLRFVGPVPDLDEIKSMCSYLSRPDDDPEGISVDSAPAVLGLYVNLGRLRARYGLRALRLGLLEAGHLAQSLLLAASALGLSTTPLGGFRDESAQELFGLDEEDEPLQYLLPLGRRMPGAGR
ncbi:thiopeptide-type bacteriocin biosynthesis protein [Streptomyces sp. NPDC059989]|uniref:thiopeptide-type bacteriocin biosynthesis protein n=1 Tax=Streptomyces sp. NPDC059989 TaxID=3347026 RepID=UPI003698795E